MKKKQKGQSVTFRPRKDLRDRLEVLAQATERPLTYYIEKAIETHLPVLEEKYAEEILKHIKDVLAAAGKKSSSAAQLKNHSSRHSHQ